MTAVVTVSDLECRDMEPGELRQLATDALAAAEWLEGQQSPA